ncbi:type I DNA topoisomerase [uncultured Gimesia sp.]|uniref:type I DNA topoisomerase n=1 Tax=uncultured Gimesia sp. TaxID=1678688 RepID=UPI0026388818|nr:type I DNA topoisomerase [uncultured Gimesia sp.]
MAKKKLKALVIVESPAKAKKIGGYLGSDYKVLASMGHVRDLPTKASDVPTEFKKKHKWATLGVNVESEFEPYYLVPQDKKKTVKELKDALKDAQELILATDEDREGESIGWHLAELLKPKVPVKRMVFSEITKEAIQEAIANPRDLDLNLVSAQETRRVLDRLYGFTLSPLLWKKIARGLSAGRVQSVAVRILVQRELERLAFRSGTYWDLKALLKTSEGAEFDSMLMTVGGKKIASGKDFDESTGKLKEGSDVLLLNEQQAEELLERVNKSDWKVTSVEQRLQSRKPPAPFTTSTLQQEGNRKLNMSARETMQVAQRLYEDGHITYMRTDSVNLSNEAVSASRERIEDLYGKDYLNPEIRRFDTKSKGAQEAHEAIRPAGKLMKTADEIGLKGQQGKLYAMIWMRTMATQMEEARLRFQTVTITADNAEFRATGRHVEFPGFFRAYVEGVDDPEAALDDSESVLPPLEENQALEASQVDPLKHETKPPARYTEATIVRKMESEGVGRPSTYASIIGTIQDRGYVNKVGSQLVPTFTALAVTRLLEKFFPNLVDLQFTAAMEQQLDDIAVGEGDRLPYLNQFYRGEAGLDEQVKAKEETIDAREICTLNLDGIESAVRVGRYGPYVTDGAEEDPISASIPENIAPADLTNELAEKLIRLKSEGPKSLGMHPEENTPIYKLFGPFGPYLQLGDVIEDGPKPKRVSIPKTVDPDDVSFELALKYLSLPRGLGEHPETGKKVNAGIGRFGPYVLHDKVYKSLAKEDDILTIELPRAVELLKQARQRSAPTPIRDLGKHPEDEEPVAIFDGRYGPYVKHGKINATIPKGYEVENVTMELAVDWLELKAAKTGAKKKATKKKAAAKTTKKAAAKKTTKKAAAKKKTTKKAPAKKSTKKKTTKKKAAKKEETEE